MKSAKQESQPRLKKDTTGKAALSNSDQRGDPTLINVRQETWNSKKKSVRKATL